MGGGQEIELADIRLSTTVGELKKKLSVPPNTRCGRSNQFENWDNRRTLADYFVKDGEHLVCVVQCVREDGQSHYDNYDEWLKSNQDRKN